MAVLAIVKVGRDFRVTIPKEVSELLELEEGNELVFFKTRDGKDVFALGRAMHTLTKRKCRTETRCLFSMRPREN